MSTIAITALCIANYTNVLKNVIDCFSWHLTAVRQLLQMALRLRYLNVGLC